jgi:hypothetical protein
MSATTGDRLHQLATYIDATNNPRGATRHQIATDLFNGRLTSADLNQLIADLTAQGAHETWQEPTNGRPRTWIRRKPLTGILLTDGWHAIDYDQPSRYGFRDQNGNLLTGPLSNILATRYDKPAS